jgi:hypothetical protein
LDGINGQKRDEVYQTLYVSSVCLSGREDITLRGVYLLAGIGALLVFLVLVRIFSRLHLGNVPTLLVVFLPYVLLGMVRIRCKFGIGFNCGWMSFSPGITWHIIPVAIGVSLMAWAISHVRLTEAVKPFSGAWLGLIWYSLPIDVIHPPSHGGPCPNIPIICHDVPLLGIGGLFYWLFPFALWAMFRVVAKFLAGSHVSEESKA